MNEKVIASYKDPSGFLFRRNDILFRQINQTYAKSYKKLIESGLYENLTDKGLLVKHVEVDLPPLEKTKVYKIIKPDLIHFISYPYEWPFSLYKEAALTTLSIQRIALDFGMILKDANAFNIQFYKGSTILIDTLSFDIYKEGAPWEAYRQFCQHFLAPLSLMANKDVRLGQMMRFYIDGIPLDLTAKLLPFYTNINLGLQTHIHFHSKIQNKFKANTSIKKYPNYKRGISKGAMIGLVENLEKTIKNLTWKPIVTEWEDYYIVNNYSDTAFNHKKAILAEWVSRVKPESVWDLGANDGNFTRIASNIGIFSVAFDSDQVAIEKNYRIVKSKKDKNILPLYMDLINPSPSIGWNNQERESFIDRAPADMVFALAIIHHLAISNNLPIKMLVDFFFEIGKWLAIEFIPKNDSQIQKILSTRVDIFSEYSQDNFETAFNNSFYIHEKIHIKESKRILYLMERRVF
jgi:hypothetical protein